MDLIGLIGALVGVLTLAGGAIAFILSVGRKDAQLDDLRKDMEKLEGRVEKAEEAALQTARLTDAVENMGERFGTEIKHLAEVWNMNNQHVQGRLEEITACLRRSASLK